MSGRDHELKTWPPYFDDMWNRDKLFDVRLNDRDFCRGDTLVLREWDPIEKEYSGRVILASVTYVCDLPDPLQDYVGMQIDIISTWENAFNPNTR